MVSHPLQPGAFIVCFCMCIRHSEARVVTHLPLCVDQSFYDGAASGMWMETGGPLFTQLAVQVVQAAPPPRYPPPYDSGFVHPMLAPSPLNSKPIEYVLGAVTASTLPLAKIEDPNLIAADDDVHTHVMYILTLGCRSCVRRKGIASALLQECIDQAGRQPNCGAVYLHVKADNVSALRFYEKNGFQNLRFLQGACVSVVLCWCCVRIGLANL